MTTNSGPGNDDRSSASCHRAWWRSDPRSEDVLRSVHCEAAASMLRDGRDPAEIARLTGVPLALLHLGAGSTARPSRVHHKKPNRPDSTRCSPIDHHRPRVLPTARAVLTGNLVLAIAAATLNLPVLLLISLLLTLPLFVTIALAARSERE